MSSQFETSQNPKKRKTENAFFQIFPILATISSVICTSLILKDYFSIEEPKQNQSKEILNLLIIFSLPFILSFSIKAIFLFYYSMRKSFLKNLFFICLLTFIPPLYPAIKYGVLTGYFFGCVFLILIFLLFYWCMKKYIKLGLFCLNSSLKIFKNTCAGIIFSNTKIMSTYFLNLSLFGISVYCFMGQYEFFEKKTESDSIYKVIPVLQSLSFVYMCFLCDTVFYIYGSAVFYFSGQENFDTQKTASKISNETSFGVACFSALLIQITNMIKSENKENNDNTILRLIVACFLEMIEFIAFQALIYNAFYGKDLISSGKMALNSLKAKGFEKYFTIRATETLMAFMNFTLSFLISTIIFLFFFLWTENTNNSIDWEKFHPIWVFPIFYSFLVFSSYAGIVQSIISGMSNSHISLYVEDPNLFNKTVENGHKFQKIIE